jgi:hypothetical protein
VSQGEKPSLAGAIALVMLGLVILVPSGLCTGVFAFGPMIQSMLHPGRYPHGGTSPALGLAFIFGGPFLLAGGSLLYAGIRRLRARRDPPE